MRNVIITIVVVALIGLAAAYFLGAFKTGAPPASTPPLTTAAVLPASPSHSPTFSPPPYLTITPTTPPSPSATANVTFGLAITGITGSGFSRTVTADISNSGTTDAHNITAKVEVFSAGSRIQISGKDYLTVDIGTLKAGMSVTKQVAMDFGMFDGIKMQQNGAQFVLTVTSDEKTQTFNYDFKP